MFPADIAELYERCRALAPSFQIEVIGCDEEPRRRSPLLELATYRWMLAWRATVEGRELAEGVLIGLGRLYPTAECERELRNLLRNALSELLQRKSNPPPTLRPPRSSL